MKKEDFYIASILVEAQKLLVQLLNEEVIKYHIERLLQNYVGYKFDNETISTVVHLLVDIPDVEIFDIDYFAGMLDIYEKEYLANRLYMISELDIYRYYLLKNEITIKDHRLLEQYTDLMNEGINGYGIDGVVEEVTEILWAKYFGNINSYSSEYLIGKLHTQKGRNTYA